MRNSRAMSRRSLLQAGFLIGGTTAAATISPHAARPKSSRRSSRKR